VTSWSRADDIAQSLSGVGAAVPISMEPILCRAGGPPAVDVGWGRPNLPAAAIRALEDLVAVIRMTVSCVS
jgi:hypothetical protein